MTSIVPNPQLPLPFEAVQGRVCRRCGLFKPLDALMPHRDCLYGREKLCRACFNTANYKRRGYTGTPKKYPLEQSTHPVCRTCGLAKPLDQYQKRHNRAGGRIGDCNACRSAKRRERNEYQRTPLATRRQRRLRRRYGLTMEAVQALYEQQQGICPICQRPIPPYPSNLTHLDHDHVTRRVRGLLCIRCNTGLGYMVEDVNLLRRAIAYLERSEG